MNSVDMSISYMAADQRTYDTFAEQTIHFPMVGSLQTQPLATPPWQH